MNRRTLLAAGAAGFALPVPFAAAAPVRRPVWQAGTQAPAAATVWRVHDSEGQDATAFLAPLSGRPLYQEHYGAEAAAFRERLPASEATTAAELWASADAAGVGLMSPFLALLLSHADDDSSLAAVLAALDAPEARLLPAYRDGDYWSAGSWDWFLSERPRLRRLMGAMAQADFPGFRRARAGAAVEAGVARIAGGVEGVDLLRYEARLTGRTFEPEIDITVLAFSKPHGIKVRGQRFLQAADYDVPTTIRIAAHELLHPPVDMDGPAATAALETLGRDALMERIVRDHDPAWGYTSLPGLLNEDLCQALDQMVSEAFGMARNPADRWHRADDGIHVLAAGLYGLLRVDRWHRTGGDIGDWLLAAATDGRLAPASLHAAAARVLERPVERLWPLDADA